MEAQDSAERPGLGRHRRTYHPQRWGPARYALQLLSLVPLSALVLLLVFLLGEILGLARAASIAVTSGLVVLGLSAVRVLRYRRPARGMHLYEHGLVAVTADGSEVVFPWSSTVLFMDGWNRYKLANSEGTVITIAAAYRTPPLSGDRIRGMRTRTVIRGVQFPDEREWGSAIRRGVRESRTRPAVAAVLSGGEVAFGNLVVRQDGLTVRRGHGRDDFTSWEDVGSVALTDRDGLVIASRGNDFPSHYAKPLHRVPNAEVFLDVARRLHGRRAPAAPVPAARNDEDMSETLALMGLYVTFGLAAWAAWRLGTRNEVEGAGDFLLAALGAVLGGFSGAVFGLALAAASTAAGETLVKTLARWTRHRRYAAAGALALGVVDLVVALGFFLLREFPSRLVPLVTLLFFGGWALLLAVKRCSESERWVVRHLPDLPGMALVALAAQQLVRGDVLTTAPAAGLFFPLAIGLSWRGWRKMKDSTRPTVKAVADIVLSVELGLVLALLVVWLANALSFSPAQVAATRRVMERIQGLTEVHWLYWLVAYTLLAVGSYAVVRRPDRVTRIRQRLRPARFGEARLPLGAFVNFGRRSLTGINVGLMVALLFAVVLAPVSEGTWKKPLAHRYAFEVQRRQYAEGAADAYEAIRQYVTTHPRAAARLRAVVVAVNRAAPSPAGGPVNRTALETARQVGRFQAATLGLDDPDPPQPAEVSEAEDVTGQLEQLDEGQQRAEEREAQADRFAELASLAITRTFDIPDLGDNGAVQILKEYLGGLVEDGPVKKVFLRWAERTGQAPPDGGRLVRIDVRNLASVAYGRTQEAVERADAGMLAFYARFGIGIPVEEPSMAQVVDLANQHRYLQQGTGPCTGCVTSGNSGTSPGGGGGGGRRS
ncbi:hypothetical protein GQS52_19970 [Streptomyces sp. SCUT-3]|uniref:hypothetical protein n=1 Tax=Streptomyces sp. SCUT-3 TaxID=2684469 RepID=UPI0015F7D8A2|nr:hypothetical protein [Streptomyces sp. SCUT-3]QMV23670.1 hypothetical protein GQS52_19970 [Streptomyces sp. SCUT-3]